MRGTGNNISPRHLSGQNEGQTLIPDFWPIWTQTFETANANVCVKMHKRLRENAHIFGSMGKMQLRHGAFGNTDGIPPLDNPTFCPPFHLLFYKKLYLCETYLERWSDTGDS